MRPPPVLTSGPFEPDKRWKHRYRQAQDAIEETSRCLRTLAHLDEARADATWSEYAMEALGCLQGALFLLYQAERARKEHIAKRAPGAAPARGAPAGDGHGEVKP